MLIHNKMRDKFKSFLHHLVDRKMEMLEIGNVRFTMFHVCKTRRESTANYYINNLL